MTYPTTRPISRNAPCSCGSGKKYKLCCGPAVATSRGHEHRRSAASEAPQPSLIAPRGTALDGTEAPVDSGAALQRALGLHRDHDLNGAEEIYRQILEREPYHAEAMHLLGMVLHQRGDHRRALELVDEALALAPDHVAMHNNRAAVSAALGNLDEAMADIRAALAVQPSYVDGNRNLASLYGSQHQAAAAVAHYREALRREPDDATLHRDLAHALMGLPAPAEAIAHYREALRLDDSDIDTYFGLALAFGRADRPLEAMDAYRSALRLQPDNPIASIGLLAQMQKACDWSEFDALLTNLQRRISVHPSVGAPLFLATMPLPAAQLLASANAWAPQAQVDAPFYRSVIRRPLREPGDPLRIGYLSGDFRTHAVAMLVVEVLEKHDRSRVHVTAYSTNNDDGTPMAGRTRRAVDRFVDLTTATDTEAARQIGEDGIDILVDLAGYTFGGRQNLLALRPAPVQVNWLGYPGTMGGQIADYIIADPIIIPLTHQRYYSERVVYMPHTYQPNDRQRAVSPQTPTRADCGLPDDAFVFCCFNNNHKILPSVFGTWMRLLRAVPGSVLWLLAGTPWVEANLRREAEARGIDGARLIFAPRRQPADHLARHRLADLFLDTSPYNAHTTASDALWAGLPVVTFLGETFASRVAASLVTAAGVPELVAESLEAYEALALRLATNSEELATLRQRLAASRESCPLFDSTRFARDLEDLYDGMWAEHQARGGGCGDLDDDGDDLLLFDTDVAPSPHPESHETDTPLPTFLPTAGEAGREEASALPSLATALKQAAEGRGESGMVVAAGIAALPATVLDEALVLALANFNDDNREAAELLCREILEIDPHNAEALHLLAQIADKSGYPEDAIILLTRAIEIMPGVPDCYSNRGNIWRKLGRLQEAAADYRSALDLHPSYPHAHNNYGVTLAGLGDIVGAEAAFREAIRLDADYGDAHANLARLRGLAHDVPPALTLAE